MFMCLRYEGRTRVPRAVRVWPMDTRSPSNRARSGYASCTATRCWRRATGPAPRETGCPVRYYLPAEDVRLDLLTTSDTHTHCPFKGDASYWSWPDAPPRRSYPDPKPDVARHAGSFCFYEVEVAIVPAPRRRPGVPAASVVSGFAVHEGPGSAPGPVVRIRPGPRGLARTPAPTKPRLLKRPDPDDRPWHARRRAGGRRDRRRAHHARAVVQDDRLAGSDAADRLGERDLESAVDQLGRDLRPRLRGRGVGRCRCQGRWGRRRTSGA